jgi:hypothetical protein
MAAILVATLVVQPVIAMAGGSGRLIPSGKVDVFSDGKEVQQIRSESPLPEGSLMVCNGNCVVQTHGLQLLAQDKSAFAVALGKEGWNIAVKNGLIEFSVNADAKPIVFHTPQDVIRVNQVIVPADSEGIVRGTLSVTEQGTRLSVEQGILNVSYNGGEQAVQPGQPIILAQATAGDNEKRPGAAVPPASGAGAAAVAGGGATIMGVPATAAAVIGGVAVAGAVAGGVAASNSSTNSPQ